jgi:tetratricopeptide (TPR) repeat protein
MKVFLSYQRRTGSWVARALKDRLESLGAAVFLDVEELSAGRFENVILNEIARRDHFIVVLTPETCETLGADADWVSREVERALDLKKNVIPVLVGGADILQTPHAFNRRTELVALNALVLSHHRFGEDVTVLYERFLSRPTIEDLEFQSAEEHFTQGMAAQGEENWLEAETQFLEAVRLASRPDYLLALGAARFRQGRYVEALADVNAAIAADPFASELRNVKFELLQQLDQMREALDLMRDWEWHAQERAGSITRRVLGRVEAGNDLARCFAEVPEFHHLYGKGPLYWRTGAAYETLCEHVSDELKAPLSRAWEAWAASNASLAKDS